MIVILLYMNEYATRLIRGATSPQRRIVLLGCNLMNNERPSISLIYIRRINDVPDHLLHRLQETVLIQSKLGRIYKY